MTMTFALYEIAKNGDGQVTYDGAMLEATYLHQVILETLRWYPVLPLLDRQCTNPDGYSLEPFSQFKIPHKMPIFIPIYPI